MFDIFIKTWYIIIFALFSYIYLLAVSSHSQKPFKYGCFLAMATLGSPLA
jgi:hypothetical protein